jgi:hypothetical protein
LTQTCRLPDIFKYSTECQIAVWSRVAGHKADNRFKLNNIPN